jgi:amidohydrolase
MHEGEWVRMLDGAVDAVTSELIRVRRHMHRHPEPSGEERETTRFLAAELRAADFQVRLGPGDRGLLVDAGAGDATIGLRADIDALRIQDTKSVEYRSCHPGLMHACGHDAHSAVVLGALLALRELERAGRAPWPFRYRGIFQPAEETGTGALEMIEFGALQGLDGILSIHADPSRAVGQIGLRDGAFTAACDSLTITLTGRGGHAARPHESLDPIAAAAQLISSIYLFIPRGADSQDAVVVTIGEVKAGDNPNVIPEQAVLRGTIRTLDERVRARTRDHIRQLARGIAEASGVRVEVDLTAGSPSVQNSPAHNRLLHRACRVGVPVAEVAPIPRPSMGGEDFAFYQAHVPGAMLRLGIVGPSVGGSALHTPNFDLDERALAIGAKILARSAVLHAQPGQKEGEEIIL